MSPLIWVQTHSHSVHIQFVFSFHDQISSIQKFPVFAPRLLHVAALFFIPFIPNEYYYYLQLFLSLHFYSSLFLPFWFFFVYQSIPLYLFLLINHLIRFFPFVFLFFTLPLCLC
ncbi:hypothetical protein PICMEDRAFT_104794 [Pichia membranifaciens NRRL Y-2026]|uniref:Uncharacterized protein n=1 Tax=Pichia membranifaciens NRRL Y-2026 TaxID=763406 RepID=A0A1E3NU48_9ASCO|nr:hypothetical protein PICMEDRAFT_104794 [Pichia membranifaciens NRRL Y-2026]ODQ49570.1 hypothetical protein PICMEDRAFT_104794 [Pichia membranifaciens NRRL Y-2026]